MYSVIFAVNMYQTYNTTIIVHYTTIINIWFSHFLDAYAIYVYSCLILLNYIVEIVIYLFQ